MYICYDCSGEFETPENLVEKHLLDAPPYEVSYVCPFCNSSNFKVKSHSHCCCCGAKLPNTDSEFCSNECRNKGIKLWKNEFKRRKQLLINPINVIIRELENYNKEHNTNYSYGQYVAIIENQRRKQKCANRKKDI